MLIELDLARGQAALAGALLLQLLDGMPALDSYLVGVLLGVEDLVGVVSASMLEGYTRVSDVAAQQACSTPPPWEASLAFHLAAAHARWPQLRLRTAARDLA